MAIIHRDPLQALERWEPFRELETLQRRMNHLFEQLVPSGNGDLAGIDYIPSVEIEETDDNFYIKLEVPGLDPQDIDIEVKDNSVSISGERKSESKTEAKGFVRSEIRYGKFERVIPLSTRVENENVKAEYKEGILSLTLPKVEAEKHKAVKVAIAS